MNSMFGLGKSEQASDKLSVQVHVVASGDAFKLGQKIWDENARTLRLDEQTGKEFLHFGYANPKCVVWMQRDQGRTDTFEVIVRWEADKTHEVYVLTSGQTAGDEARAKAILNSMLTTPSVVLSTDK
jgi:hypothetical protein